MKPLDPSYYWSPISQSYQLRVKRRKIGTQFHPYVHARLFVIEIGKGMRAD